MVEIPSTMKAVYLPGQRRCEIRTVPVPHPAHGQVLVHMRASSLCGSDLRLIYRPATHAPGPDGYRGVVAGHEPCGQIVQRGAGVPDAWKEGTRVVVYHIQGCGACLLCRRGEYISCEAPERMAYGWQRDGGHAEYLLADTQSLVRLPDELTYLDGALAACGLGTAYAACTRARVSGADRVLITGLGPVGLGTALLAARFGASVLALEPDAARAAFARRLGIACVDGGAGVGADADADVQRVLDWASDADGAGVHVAIDCSGSPAARHTCLRAARTWGRVVFVGEGGDVAFDVSRLVIHKSLAIYGSWVCSVGQMHDLLACLVRWGVHPEIIVTHTFAIDDAAEAYALFDGGKTGKCAILFDGEQKKFHV